MAEKGTKRRKRRDQKLWIVLQRCMLHAYCGEVVVAAYRSQRAANSAREREVSYADPARWAFRITDVWLKS